LSGHGRLALFGTCSIIVIAAAVTLALVVSAQVSSLPGIVAAQISAVAPRGVKALFVATVVIAIRLSITPILDVVPRSAI
jgi:hypothetical protein